MTAASGGAESWSWPEQGFDGPREFAERVRESLAVAAARGWNELILSDPDFADWPLGERAVAQSMQDWAASGRSLRMVAVNFDALARLHARFVSWRQHWDHIIQCRACSRSGAPEVPSAIWTPEGVLHRTDPLRSRGLLSADPVRRVALRQSLDECFQQGRAAFAASVLGL